MHTATAQGLCCRDIIALPFDKTVRSVHCAPGVFLAREDCHLPTDTGDVTTLRHTASLCLGLELYRRRPVRLGGSCSPGRGFGSNPSSCFQLPIPGRKAGLCKGAECQSWLCRWRDKGSVGRSCPWICVSRWTASLPPQEEMQREASEARGPAVPNGTRLPKSPAPEWLAWEPLQVGLAKSRCCLSQRSGK